MNLPPVLRQRYLDANGNPLASGKLYTYQAGTTTLQATYTDHGGGTPSANPIILDANGEAAMWLDPTLSYKFVLKTSADVTQWTVDNVIGILTSGAVVTASIADDAVTQAKIADDAVGADQLKDSAGTDGDRAVTTDHIRNDAIVPLKLESQIVVDPINVGLAATVGSNALTISLKTAAGADASATTPIRIPFRSSTAATGTPVVRSATAATSVVISSGSTLGSTDGDANWVYVYAIDNAGTVELAVSGQRIADDSSLVTTTAEGGAGGADSAYTIYSTTARSNVAIRLLGRVKSTQATAGTWVTAPSEIAVTLLERQAPRSQVHVYTGAGRGSTNTCIRRFGNTLTNIGTAITYADSAENGGSFTINEDGLYAISYTDGRTGGASDLAVSRNSTELTTNGAGIVATDRIAYTESAAANLHNCCSFMGVLRAGDIIRAHVDTDMDSTSVLVMFNICKVGA